MEQQRYKVYYHLSRVVYITAVLLCFNNQVFSQSGNCSPNTPFFAADLSNDPNGTWTSPAVARAYNCCGTSPPDRCIEFSITLSPKAVSINFALASGAIPTGALYYQINCGPQITVGSPICLSGPGPYQLTFCKPGNNINTYAITSMAAPAVSPDDSVDNGCTTKLYTSGLLVDATIKWNSVYPGVKGAYNSYLSCTIGCDSTTVTGTPGAPPYVDYEVCGTPLGGACVSSGSWCDVVRVYFSPPIVNSVNPNPASFCANNPSGVALTGSVSGGAPPYTYKWTDRSNGFGTTVSTSLTYTATAAGPYSFIVYDQNYPKCPQTITNVLVSVDPVPTANAGPDQTICGNSVTLNGTVTNATGGIWSGGSGVFTPNNTAGNATYTPTTTELNSGTIVLTYTSTGNGTCNSASDQVVIHISPPTNVTLTAPSVVCYNQTATITANVTSGLGPFTYAWSNGQNTQTITNVPAGVYTVTVTGASGCRGTASVTINSNPQIILSTSPNNNVFCGTSATISSSASGGTGTLSYLWSNGATTPSITVSTGTYIIIVTDNMGCTTSKSVSVTSANSTLAVSVNQPSIICHGATTTLSATATGGYGSYSYSWNNGSTSSSIVVGAGNYCITATDGAGCIATACVQVTENPALSVSASPPSNVCYGTSATVNAFVTGGSAPYSYAWSNGQNTQSITAMAGNYVIVVTDIMGCTSSANVTISQAAVININMTSTSVKCYGGNDGSATASVSGGVLPYYYSWSPYGGASATAPNLMSGTFTVTVTDAIGCQKKATVMVTQPTAISATVVTNNNVKCFGGSDGSATVNASGGIPGYTYSWSPFGGIGQSSSVLSEGTYVVTVTDNNGCTQTAQTTISQPTSLSATISKITNASCNGGATGSSTVSASGGTPAYTFAWSSGDVDSTAINLTAGTYTVVVTDYNGCTKQATATITQPPALTATIGSSTNVSCYNGKNGTATATGSGGTGPYTYLWNTSPAQTTAKATGLKSGNYSITITDSRSCVTTSAVVTITQPPLLTVSVTPSSTISCDVTIIISATASGGTAGYFYMWSTGDAGSSVTVNTGVYSATATDAMGCVATASVSVKASNSTLTANITPPPNICNGATTSISITTSGGLGGNNYLWSNSSTAPSITVGAGSYCAKVTDAGGCIATACATVVENPPLAVSVATPQSVCQGATGTITAVGSGGQPPYFYLWSTGETTQSITQYPGIYTVKLYDVTGISCSASTNVTISEEAPISITMSHTDVNCFGMNTGTASAFVSGGAPAYSYVWYPSGGTGATATRLAGGKTYTVIVTDAIGCIGNGTATVIQPPSAVAITTSKTDVSCFGGADGTASAIGSGGIAPYVYYWYGTGASTATASGLSAGSYSVTVADYNGCYVMTSFQLYQSADITVNGTSQAASCSKNNGSATAIASGGTGILTYVWYPSGGNASVASNLMAGSYTVFVRDAKNCQKQLAINVASLPAVLTSDFNSTDICFNKPTVFNNLSSTASSGTSITGSEWNFGDGSPVDNSINPTHTYATPGVFNVSLKTTSSQGCDATKTKQVTVYSIPLASFSSKNACSDSVVTFKDLSTSTSGNINKWYWNFGDGSPVDTIQNPLHLYSKPNTYNLTLMVATDNGCADTVINPLTVSPTPFVDFDVKEETGCSSNCTIFKDLTTLQDGVTISSRTWDFGDGSLNENTDSVRHCFSKSGVHSISLTNITSLGCAATKTIIKNIELGPILTFFVPNAFTPGRSIGLNDNFSGVGTNICKYEMWIFDRWGNLIFHTDDIDKKWDGRANEGKDIAQKDVYVYKIKITDYRGEEHLYKGEVTLIR